MASCLTVLTSYSIERSGHLFQIISWLALASLLVLLRAPLTHPESRQGASKTTHMGDTLAVRTLGDERVLVFPLGSWLPSYPASPKLWWVLCVKNTLKILVHTHWDRWILINSNLLCDTTHEFYGNKNRSGDVPQGSSCRGPTGECNSHSGGFNTFFSEGHQVHALCTYISTRKHDREI